MTHPLKTLNAIRSTLVSKIQWLRLPLAGVDGRISQVLCHDEELASRRLLLTPPAGAAIHQKSNLFAA